MMETNLLDKMLAAYHEESKPVTVTLQNKIRVSGKIKAFDSYVIVMDGQKREIVYRHAVSSLQALAAEEQKRPALVARPVQAVQKAKPAAKPVMHKPRQPQPHATLSAPSVETNINSAMKEGLLRWMQEQKAAK